MEKTTLEKHEESSLKNGKYPIFWKDQDSNCIYMQESGFSYYYVQVLGLKNGGYHHHRGYVVESGSLDFSEFEPATKYEYQEMMKDYFAADKKLREKFIDKIYANS